MTLIKPISDLRNHFNEISEICHQTDEPIFISKNGKGDLVIMSLAKYDQLIALLELYQKLSVSETESQNSDGRITHNEMMDKMRKKIHGEKLSD